MKSTFLHYFILFLLFTLSLLSVYAQDSVQWHLPEGAKARFGKGNINDVAYSPDGKTFAVATSIGVWLYDAHNFQERALLGAHTNRIGNVAYSPDSRTIAAVIQREIVLWNVTDGTQRATFPNDTGYGSSVVFSPDGNLLVSTGWDGTVLLWDISLLK